jgi:DNA-binding MarR family transcriptional regulator
MMKDKLGGSLVKIFSLKYIMFRNFDTTELAHCLNQTEERVLMFAWDHGGTSMQFLSRKVGLEKGSLTTVIDSLESAGLVSRMRDPTDRRSFIVNPTPEGSRLAENIDALFDRHLEKILGKLTPEDRTEFERAAATFARLIPVLATQE